MSLFSTTAFQHAALTVMLCRNNDEDAEIILNNLRTHKYQALGFLQPISNPPLCTTPPSIIPHEPLAFSWVAQLLS